MRLVIETWMNKVIEDANSHFGTRVSPEFILANKTSYPNGGGWKTKNKWKKWVKNYRGFVEFTKEGAAKIQGGKYYGISSYQLVYLED